MFFSLNFLRFGCAQINKCTPLGRVPKKAKQINGNTHMIRLYIHIKVVLSVLDLTGPTWSWNYQNRRCYANVVLFARSDRSEGHMGEG